MSLPIYMDNHATTRVDDRVLQSMLPYFSETYGNAASKNHIFGMRALTAVEQSRGTIADSIGALDKEIYFTAGATESVNLAMKGVFELYRAKGNHIIVSAAEHPCVLGCAKRLERAGAEVTVLPVDKSGSTPLEILEREIRDTTVLVCIMAANNEIGTLNPISAIGKICADRSTLFLCDATQAVGKVPIDVSKMNIHLLAASAHKFYGPKGIGILYTRKSDVRVKLSPQMDGGGHERGLRSGTVNVPGAVGMAAALQLSIKEAKSDSVRKLRDFLEREITTSLPHVLVNGSRDKRLSGNLSLTIVGVESEALLIALKDDVAISTGSACTTEKVEPSHVLKAIGLDDESVHSTVRIGLGRFNTFEECKHVAARIVDESRRLRELSVNYKKSVQRLGL